jgi:hypothetical protein
VTLPTVRNGGRPGRPELAGTRMVPRAPVGWPLTCLVSRRSPCIQREPAPHIKRFAERFVEAVGQAVGHSSNDLPIDTSKPLRKPPGTHRTIFQPIGASRRASRHRGIERFAKGYHQPVGPIAGQPTNDLSSHPRKQFGKPVGTHRTICRAVRAYRRASCQTSVERAVRKAS